MTMTTKSDFKVGDKVKLAWPGHVCSRFDTAEVYALESITSPNLLVLRFENGLIANCDKERLSRL